MTYIHSRVPQGIATAITMLLLAATAHAQDAHAHAHGVVEAPEGMTVALDVQPDPISGYNVHIATTGFTWAPEHASGTHVAGEGHAHLYVNGEKVARVYGAWFHLGSVPDGGAEVRVTLNTNAHDDYAHDGTVVADTVRLEPAGTGTSDHDADDATQPEPHGSAAGPVGANTVEAGDHLVRVEPVLADDGRLVVALTALGRRDEAIAEVAFTGTVRAPSGREAAFGGANGVGLASFARLDAGAYHVEGDAAGVPFETELVALEGTTDLGTEVVAFLMPPPAQGRAKAEAFVYAFARGENVHGRYAASLAPVSTADGDASQAELAHTHFGHLHGLPFAPAGNQASLAIAGDGPWRLVVELGAGVTESVAFEVPHE